MSTNRKCIRFVPPQSDTQESWSGTALTVVIRVPFDIINQWAGIIPNSGPDTLTMNYSDSLGQTGTLTRNVTFWGTDTGWAFISQDGTRQFLVSGIDGALYDSYAVTINARNTTASAAALTPCSNPGRYGACDLVTNQVRPVAAFIVDGNVEQPPSYPPPQT